MIALTAAEVALVTGGALHAIDPATVVAGPVVTDSREVIPGALFVAVAGEHSDGHAFAAKAVAAVHSRSGWCQPATLFPARPND